MFVSSFVDWDKYGDNEYEDDQEDSDVNREVVDQ